MLFGIVGAALTEVVSPSCGECGEEVIRSFSMGAGPVDGQNG
jgi:hypothetical protein